MFTMLSELSSTGGDHRIYGIGRIPRDHLVHPLRNAGSCNVLQDLLRTQTYSFFSFMVGLVKCFQLFVYSISAVGFFFE